jgi:hypothetical protein
VAIGHLRQARAAVQQQQQGTASAGAVTAGTAAEEQVAHLPAQLKVGRAKLDLCSGQGGMEESRGWKWGRQGL